MVLRCGVASAAGCVDGSAVAGSGTGGGGGRGPAGGALPGGRAGAGLLIGEWLPRSPGSRMSLRPLAARRCEAHFWFPPVPRVQAEAVSSEQAGAPRAGTPRPPGPPSHRLEASRETLIKGTARAAGSIACPGPARK